MPSQFSPDQVDQAMVALGAKLPAFDGQQVSVASLGDADFTDEGDLILLSPSVRTRFGRAAYAATETQKLTYNAGMDFAVLCYAQNLRSRQQERWDCLRLIGMVQQTFAGARLQIEDGSWTQPLELLSVEPVMNEGQVIDQYYSVVFRVPALAQFSGANSNFGVK